MIVFEVFTLYIFLKHPCLPYFIIKTDYYLDGSNRYLFDIFSLYLINKLHNLFVFNKFIFAN